MHSAIQNGLCNCKICCNELAKGNFLNKFLLSMRNGYNKYTPTVLSHQTQPCNTILTKQCDIIEYNLLFDDESSDSKQCQANFIATKIGKTLICYQCKLPDHIHPNCPKLKNNREQNKKADNANPI